MSMTLNLEKVIFLSLIKKIVIDDDILYNNIYINLYIN